MKRSALILLIATAACSADHTADEVNNTSSISSEATINIPGQLLNAGPYKTYDSRVLYVSRDGDTGHILLQLAKGDIGGFGEIASSIRNITTAFKNDTDTLNGVTEIYLRALSSDMDDLGNLTLRPHQMITSDPKTMNHPAALALVSAKQLTDLGKNEAVTWCERRSQETPEFCADF